MYKIEIYLWTGRDWKGNCSHYFVKGIYGRNVCFTGIENAKVYSTWEKALKAKKIVAKRLVAKRLGYALINLYEV